MHLAGILYFRDIMEWPQKMHLQGYFAGVHPEARGPGWQSRATSVMFI